MKHSLLLLLLPFPFGIVGHNNTGLLESATGFRQPAHDEDMELSAHAPFAPTQEQHPTRVCQDDRPLPLCHCCITHRAGCCRAIRSLALQGPSLDPQQAQDLVQEATSAGLQAPEEWLDAALARVDVCRWLGEVQMSTTREAFQAATALMQVVPSLLRVLPAGTLLLSEYELGRDSEGWGLLRAQHSDCRGMCSCISARGQTCEQSG